MTVVHVEHGLLHTIERWGIAAAVVATVSMIVGEVIAARGNHSRAAASRGSAASKAPARVVRCEGGAEDIGAVASAAASA
eukprot:CAMPEP_0198528802 /NCGR_PEP_ID=MMETSP1462-20131121/25376_1 /TAXON_ID=1333877 /ORGANISM="Brandtodinium nutriculum, Strain RCC3387" /LENGTH=79 /DNA_ID=CAMNT_0044258633 /DNA_START=8 /DNA_END=247 /DNA_ORIENTATION=+